MIAKIKMANDTRRPICIKGAKALNMDFRTTCRPENSVLNKFVEVRFFNVDLRNNEIIPASTHPRTFIIILMTVHVFVRIY